jgi:hypothetical protein
MLSSNIKKIAKLIRMLGSSNEGEVLNSVRLIGNILSKSGENFNDFADYVESVPKWAKDMANEEKLRTQEKTSRNHGGAYNNTFIRDCQEIMQLARDSLSTIELKFITDVLKRFETNPRYQLSQKQTDWIHLIYNRYIAKTEPTQSHTSSPPW